MQLEQFQVLENTAKRNIVATALLTQTEAQKELIAQQTGAQTCDTPNKSSGKDSPIGLNGSMSTTPKATNWNIAWDFSLHKLFPVMKLSK